MVEMNVLQETRLKIVNRAILTIGYLSPLILALSMYRIRITGWDNIYLFHAFILTMTACVMLFRNKLPFWFKAAYITLAFFVAAVFGLVKFGLAGQGTALLIISALYAVTFYGARSIPTTALVSLLALLMIWGLHTYEWTGYAANIAEQFTSPVILGVNLAYTLIFVYLVTFTVGSFIHAMIEQASSLHDKNIALTKTLAELKTLTGIIPICSLCKNIRSDAGSWQRLEQYIHEHSNAEFSHGICPDCLPKHKEDLRRQLSEHKEKNLSA